MQNKVSVNTNIGMLRDRSISKVDNQFAFENHNIRITARDKDTLLSVTNERGNTPISLIADNEGIGIGATDILGTLLGYAVLNKYLVLFTTDNNTDRIYRIEYLAGTGTWKGKILYEGNLSFSTDNPIETIPFYETEDVQKVYWVDGKNQPRFINIKRAYYTVVNSTVTYDKSTSFDFVTDYNNSGRDNVDISVTKQFLGMGSFPAGTIQYLCTYYNKFGQETNAVYVSPIYYISPENRGGSPEETLTCSFKISITNADLDFDYVRVYAVIRTSESGNPISYIVGDINIKEEKLEIVDTGQGDNAAIDPTILLFIGGREIVAGTFSHKDNTLFLGDLDIKSAEKDDLITQAIKALQESPNNKVYNPDTFESNVITFVKTNGSYSSYATPYYKNEGLYAYTSELNYSSDKITGFKGGEKYRFGVQFISGTGQKSKVFFVGDKTNTLYPSVRTTSNSAVIERPIVRIILPASVVQTAIDAGYKEVTLLMAQATEGDRSVVAQGIVNPTVFNLGQRYSNAPFAVSSWFMRPRNSMMNSRHFESVNNFTNVTKDAGTHKVTSANVTFCEIQNIEPDRTPYYNSESFDEILVRTAFVIKSTCLESGNNPLRLWKMHYRIKMYAMKLYIVSGNPVWKTISGAVVNDGWPYPTQDSDAFDSNDYDHLALNNNCLVQNDDRWFSSKEKYLTIIQEWISSLGIKDSTYWPTETQQIFGQTENQTTTFSKDVHVAMTDSSSKSYYSRLNAEQYFIDENVVTFNTPDIETLQSSTWNGLRFRIVGISEVTSNITDYSIQTTTGRSNSAGIYKTAFNHTNSRFIEGLMTYPLLYDLPLKWDAAERKYLDVNDDNPHYFCIFPFHKEGSVIYNGNQDSKESSIEKKTISNLRYCYDTKYLWTGNDAWKPEGDDALFKGIDMAITSGEQSNQYKQIATDYGSYIYQGTYDYLSSVTEKSYGIYVSDSGNLDEETVRNSAEDVLVNTDEPVRIQFQSLSHVVMKLPKRSVNGIPCNVILPALSDDGVFAYPTPATSGDDYQVPWDDVKEIVQDTKEYSTTTPYYFIGELYKPFDSTNDDRYGGTTEYALEGNTFITISDRVRLSSGTVTVIGTEGDTYFQRWDCQKTEPYSNESKNGIVDITSFLVETHTNIDGRYDVRRGFIENVTTSRENSNLVNRAYSNISNFFTARILDDKYDLSAFPNQITWTKTKTLSEDIDTWSNITLASTLDFDGDKGRVRAIRRFNNSLIAFQDRGISEILFNSRTQLSTTAGVPIEIGNSGKVEGKRYISEKAGCLNKWSIVETKSGIYFIDNINKNISVIGQGIQELSSAKGFDAWIKSYNSTDVWNPVDFNNFVSYYDGSHGDIYFIRKHETAYNEDGCLVFNENLGQFTSFFDYNDVPMMVGIQDKFVSFKNVPNLSDLWIQNEGEYNKIYGTTYPYWMTYRICPDPYGDKTFNNIEYRADIIRKSTDSDVVEYPDNLVTNRTFDKLKVWNEYQIGESDLKYDMYKVSDIKKKFRIWRANIPRDSKDPRGLNRIRNPWTFIQLKKDKDLFNERMEFHDLMVKYYE